MSDTKVLLPHIKLHFNVEHPTLEESYLYGYECATYDVSEEENPYIQGTKEHEQWSDGWWASFYGEDPLFTTSSIEPELTPANDNYYQDEKENYVLKFFEISGVLVISAIVGYQIFELVG